MQSKVGILDWIVRGAAAALLWVLADAAAMGMWIANPPWIYYTFGRSVQIFELQAFTHMLALLGMGALFLPLARRLPGLRWPLAVFLVWALFYQTLFQSFGKISYDYLAWAHGAQSQLLHGNPYMGTENPTYWYPPALAQMLAGFYRGLDALFPALRIIKGSHSGTIAHLTFYLFQCTQQMLLMSLFWFAYAFCRDLRIPSKTAALSLGLLLLVNVPLYRMLWFHQANLWLVNTFFMVLLFRDRSPMLTGLAIAWGFHMKLYPAILGLPLLLAGYWRCLIWSAVFAALILAFQVEWGRNLEVWTRFLQEITNPHVGSFYRDNSLHGIAKNLLKPFGLTRFDVQLTYVFQLAAVGWLGSRIVRRERLYWPLRRTGTAPDFLFDYRFLEHFMDTVVLGLLLSPLVFEHHYAMALPLVIWTLLTRLEAAPRRVLIGIVMMFFIPIYDVVPFGWNRIAGLFILMSARPVDFPAAWPHWPASAFRRIMGESQSE